MAVADLPAAERKQLLEDASQAIEESVLPAFEELAETMGELTEIAPTKNGVGQFPKGSQYYEYVLRHHTTTDLTPEQVHELGLQELERIHGEMREVFDELGYPQGEDLPDLFLLCPHGNDTNRPLN
jgi:uncharacterized protein (DUF885 family)